MRVKDIIDSETKTWRLSAIHGFLPAHVAEEIKAKPISDMNGSGDQIIWSHGKNEDVTVREAYNYPNSNMMGNDLPNNYWRFLWILNYRKLNSFCGCYVITY